MNFANITDWIIPEGTVTQVTDSLNRVIWQKTQPVVLKNYFYIEDTSGQANTVSIVKSYSDAPDITVYCSTDQQNWSNMGTTSTTPITATVPANGKLYLKATTYRWGVTGNSSYRNTITASGNHNVGGNIMSLLYDDNFENAIFVSSNEKAFYHLFNNNTHLVSAVNLELPVTTLINSCYMGMFDGCTSLTTAPVLPATTLADSCYCDMFWNCTALTTAPALPAKTLVSQCYRSMFNGCTNLNSVTTYAQDISASNCLYAWLHNVASSGDFYNLGTATYPSGVNGIPTGWTTHTTL